MATNNKIDYNNLQSHIEVIVFNGTYYLCDINHKTTDKGHTYKIAVLDVEFCDWWKITQNRSFVMNYFKNKYKNQKNDK